MVLLFHREGTLLSKDLRGYVVSYRASMLICIAIILYSRYELLGKAHNWAMHRYLLLNTLTRFRWRDPGNYIYRPVTSISLLSHPIVSYSGNWRRHVRIAFILSRVHMLASWFTWFTQNHSIPQITYMSCVEFINYHFQFKLILHHTTKSQFQKHLVISIFAGGLLCAYFAISHSCRQDVSLSPHRCYNISIFACFLASDELLW